MRVFAGLPILWTADVSALECDAVRCRRSVATTGSGRPRGWREYVDGRVSCPRCHAEGRRHRKLAGAES